MSNFDHYEIEVGREESVQVILEEKAKIYLVDDRNWQRLRTQQRFRYCGRREPRSSVVLRPDRPGRYHVVIATQQKDKEAKRSEGSSASVTLI